MMDGQHTRHSLVETEDHGAEVGGLHGALESANLVRGVTPEHDPVVKAKVIGALRLLHVPIVDTADLWLETLWSCHQ